jgi:hypothetical protein
VACAFVNLGIIGGQMFDLPIGKGGAQHRFGIHVFGLLCPPVP